MFLKDLFKEKKTQYIVLFLKNGIDKPLYIEYNVGVKIEYFTSA